MKVEEEAFLIFLRKVFAQKRKTLANNLRAAGIEPQAVAMAIERAGIEAQARAETLSVEKLAALWREIASPQGAEAPLIMG